MRPLNAASPKHFKLSYKVWKKEKKKKGKLVSDWEICAGINKSMHDTTGEHV